MKRGSAFPARRRAQMIDLIRHQGQCTIQDLAAEFDTSKDTIRRDLDALAEQGLVQRTHGGASLAAEHRVNALVPFARRLGSQAAAKDRIGRAAAALVSEGEQVFINGGTTTLAMAKHLTAVGITVVTNSLFLPEPLCAAGVREVYVLGGLYRLRSQVTVGPAVLPDGSGHFRTLHADIALIGVGGIANDGAVTTTSLPEAGTMRGMMDSAERTVLLADSTKFGHRQFAEICQLSARTTLVTDAEPPAQLLAVARDAGTEIIVAAET